MSALAAPGTTKASCPGSSAERNYRLACSLVRATGTPDPFACGKGEERNSDFVLFRLAQADRVSPICATNARFAFGS